MVGLTVTFTSCKEDEFSKMPLGMGAGIKGLAGLVAAATKQAKDSSPRGEGGGSPACDGGGVGGARGASRRFSKPVFQMLSRQLG